MSAQAVQPVIHSAVHAHAHDLAHLLKLLLTKLTSVHAEGRYGGITRVRRWDLIV